MSRVAEFVAYIRSSTAFVAFEAAYTVLGKIIACDYPGTLRHRAAILASECGYPFHLQVTSREYVATLTQFLPSQHCGVIGQKILSMLQEWRCSFVETSPFKDDFAPNAETVALLNQAYTYRTHDQFLEMRNVVQTTKLHDLVRRGTRADLRNAQALLHTMAQRAPSVAPHTT
ncbi:ARF-binding protein [Malassezia vespertilionis]|uniref:ARF-binding protein n=1 Tax=Malassezia vespertilionis TaxID=2020962 RepID=UPI0024B08909|nr:ARF-binding protein [Malassezia vespertilionis]WFD08324.1 ARF-binding protein [Malassezia vespertilionis]